MEAVLGIGLLVGVIAAYVAYGNWLTSGIRPRKFETSVPSTRLRELFASRVGRAGWRIVDDGNPMLAQSSLVTGIRQQIGLSVRSDPEGRSSVVVGPHRWVTKWGVPKKGHTIRLRLDTFVDAVRAEDAAIDVRTEARR